MFAGWSLPAAGSWEQLKTWAGEIQVQVRKYRKCEREALSWLRVAVWRAHEIGMLLIEVDWTLAAMRKKGGRCGKESPGLEGKPSFRGRPVPGFWAWVHANVRGISDRRLSDFLRIARNWDLLKDKVLDPANEKKLTVEWALETLSGVLPKRKPAERKVQDQSERGQKVERLRRNLARQVRVPDNDLVLWVWKGTVPGLIFQSEVQRILKHGWRGDPMAQNADEAARDVVNAWLKRMENEEIVTIDLDALAAALESVVRPARPPEPVAVPDDRPLPDLRRDRRRARASHAAWVHAQEARAEAFGGSVSGGAL